MKTLNIWIFLLPLLLSFTHGNAQTGKIRGTVVKNTNGKPVIGANVHVSGTTKGDATDLDGRFEIAIKPGVYDLRLTYISLRTKKIRDVKVKKGKVNFLGKLYMAKDSGTLSEVEVTAERVKNNEKAMLSLKKQSTKMIDAISAEKFKETGDGDAAEAMKRVTGVSVQDDKYVFVRGLGGRYTKTTLNGVSIPGLDPNKNSLQMDIFPTNILSNMVVSKNFTADLPADFTGGLVNIETNEFPGKKTFNVSVGLGYNPAMHFNSDHLTYEGGKLDFLGFDDGTREIPTSRSKNIPTYVDAVRDKGTGKYQSILRDFNPNMSVERKSSMMDGSFGFSLGNQTEKGDVKIGYNLALTYENSTRYYDSVQYNFYGKPEDPTEYGLEARELQNGGYGKNNVLIGALGGLGLKTENAKYKLNILRLQNGEKKAGLYDYTGADQGANFKAKQHNLEYTQRSLTNILLSGEHSNADGSWKLNWKASPTFSSIKSPDIRYSRIRTDGSGFSVGSESGIPKRIWRFLEEVNYQGQVNLIHQYQFNDREAELNFGGSYTYKQRDYEIQAFDIVPQKDVQITRNDPRQIMKEENLWTPENKFGTVYKPNFIPNNSNKYKSNVNKPSVYVSNEMMPLKRLSTTLGLRVEKYTQRYTGIDPVTNKQLNNKKFLDHLDLFPSVNLTYELTPDQNLRASYSRTIARPSFKEASKATIFDPITGKTFIGGFVKDQTPSGEVIWDGELTATRINNFDLRWEWFQKGEQMISLTGFYKSFDNPIEMVQFLKAKNNIQPRNVGDGQIIGLEFEIRQNLGRISNALSNFSFNGNFTLNNSQIKIGPNEMSSRIENARKGKEVDETRAMAGQAPYIINAGIGYKGDKNGIQGGLYYNVKGKTLHVVGVGYRPDVYTEPFHNLKFNIGKTFGKNDQLELNVKVSNLLNDDQAKLFQAYEAKDQYYSRKFPHRSFSLSVGYNFY